MKIKLFVTGGLLVGVGLFGGVMSAEAYQTRAIPLSPTQTLLVTTYSETLLNHDGVVPFVAHSGKTASHNPLIASFEVRGTNLGSLASGTQAALILSNQPIENGGYAFTTAEKNTLMLITIVTHAPGVSGLSAQLTALPILLTTNGIVESKTIKSY